MGKINLIGQRFGRLVVIGEAGRSKSGYVLWKCRCDCGSETVVSSDSLRSGDTTSCGCFQRERSVECNTKHGLRRHPLYTVWRSMLTRTGVYKGANDDNNRRNYIGRGISVCEEWQDFRNFYEWSVAHGYETGLQIDRTDNDLGYSPDNCRWVTQRENTNNRRNTRMLCGCSLAMLCSELGIETSEDGGPSNIYERIAMYHTRHKGQKVHHELVFAMLRDTERQQRLLDETIIKRKRAEAELERLKALLRS